MIDRYYLITNQGQFQTFGQRGASWQAKQAKKIWHLLHGGANFYKGVPTINLQRYKGADI